MSKINIQKIFFILFPICILALNIQSSYAASSKQKPVFICTTTEGVLTIRTKCKTGETKVTATNQLQATPDPTYLLAAGRIGFDGEAQSKILGVKATNFTSTRADTGTFDVNITGDFSGILTASDSTANRQKVVVTTSAVTFNSGYTNAEVNEADSTHIKIRFLLQKTNTSATENQNGFFFNALLAN